MLAEVCERLSTQVSQFNLLKINTGEYLNSKYRYFVIPAVFNSLQKALFHFTFLFLYKRWKVACQILIDSFLVNFLELVICGSVTWYSVIWGMWRCPHIMQHASSTELGCQPIKGDQNRRNEAQMHECFILTAALKGFAEHSQDHKVRAESNFFFF